MSAAHNASSLVRSPDRCRWRPSRRPRLCCRQCCSSDLPTPARKGSGRHAPSYLELTRPAQPPASLSRGGRSARCGIALVERSYQGATVIEDGAFAPAEWATLRFAPFWVLAAIAGRQSGFDPVEFDVFTQVVEEASARARGRFGGDLLQRVALDFDRLAAAFGDDRRSVVTG